MEPKDRFEIAREIIRHEDGLVNNRVTWLLILQGLLFNAFVNGVIFLEKIKHQPELALCVALGLVLIGSAGIGTALTTGNVVRFAHKQGEAARDWWNRTGTPDNYPPFAGIPSGWYYRIFSTSRLPYMLAMVWCVIVILLLIAVS